MPHLNEPVDNVLPERPRRAWPHYLLVAAAAAVICFWRFGAPTLSDHEAHMALTARAMADAEGRWWLREGNRPYELIPHTALNHWIVPVENGRPRLVKTPLPYWLAGGIGRLAGGVDERVARLGSCLAAVGCACVTLWLGRRMFSARAALMGTLFFVTTIGFQKWGRSARPEMLLCFFMTAAMALFWRGLQARRKGTHVLWMAAFWLAMGLGNLSKQYVPLLLGWPLAAYVFWRADEDRRGQDTARRDLAVLLTVTFIGWAALTAVSFLPALHWWRATGLSAGAGSAATMAVCLGGPVAWLMMRGRPWGRVARLLPTALPGAAIMLAMFLPWMHAMRERFPDYASQVFSDQVADRAAGTGSWSPDDPSKYLTGLLTLSLPWVGLLGCVATPLMKRFADRRRPLTYLLLWCAGLVALFASAAGKREHYILPMIPALCLLMGFVAEDVFFRHRWISPRLARTLSLGYGLAAPVGVATVAVLWALGVGQLQWGPLMVVAVLAGVPVAAAGAQGLRGRLPHVPVLLVAGFGLLMVGYWQVYPMHDDRRGIEEFAREVARLVPEDEPLHHFGDPQAKTVFYAGRQIPGLNWPIWHEMWRRSGEPPRPAAVQAELARRLEGQPAFAPWIVGYQAALGKRRPEADRLAELGYEVVHEYHGIQERRYVFTLWHRPVEAATTRNTAAR